MILRELDFTRLKEAVSIEQVLAQRGLLDGLGVRTELERKFGLRKLYRNFIQMQPENW